MAEIRTPPSLRFHTKERISISLVLISFAGFFQLDTRPEFAEELCGRVVVLTGRRGLLAA